MNKIGERIKALREERGMSLRELALKCEISKSSISMYESGERRPKYETLEALADTFNVDLEYLLGKTEVKNRVANELGFDSLEEAYRSGYREKITPPPEAFFMFDKKTHMIPLFESAAAGFGLIADNSIVDYIPLNFNCDIESQETICVKVHGDSMYPKIEDGDIVQVHKQESVDSGSLAVVLLDGEEGLVKKVVYGDDWIELHSINPMYKTLRFDKQEVLRLRVVGLVKKIIKDA